MTTINEPLSILVSSRIRLSDEERRTLKQAYNELSNAEQPSPGVTQGVSGITTVSAPVQTNVEREIGMSRLVFMDLTNSRDTISVALVLKLQKALGVNIVDKKRLMSVCKSYVDYLFTEQ